VAQAMGLTFNRIQFTPDLMPSDITGTQIIETHEGARSYRFRKGPVFAHLLLADEINRTPPKTQAALLESMQEGAVTSDGVAHKLGPPFHVLATQNPLEQEGTYPLPEAQLDRFMMMLQMDYPSYEEELEVVRRTPSAQNVVITPQMSVDDLLSHQRLVAKVPIAEAQLVRAVRMVRRTRPQDSEAPKVVREHITFGAGPRAAQALVTAAKARAVMQGRFAVDDADLNALAHPVLRHRLIVNFAGQAEGTQMTDVVDGVLASLS
jgi:MoxR-like ATPase